MNTRARVIALLPLLALAGMAQAPAEKMGKFKLTETLPCREVISQDQTGTCWSFATVSFLETEAQRITGEAIDLSEIHPVRFAAVEKCKRYVMLEGHTQFSQGGLSHDVIEMVRRHGIVPASAYSGLPEGKKRHNHGKLFAELQEEIKGLTKAKRPPDGWVAKIEAIVDQHLGAPPETIEVAGKKMTPKQYADEVLKLSCKDYVEVMSFGYAPFYEHAELLVPDNWMHYGGYLNLPIDEFMRGMDHALETGYSVAIDIDVSERGFNGATARLSEKEEAGPPITQEARDAMFEDRRTTDDHLMHIVGTSVGEDGKRYYVTKNSWGKGSGIGGYVMMSERYVRAKALAYMVHKDGLPRPER